MTDLNSGDETSQDRLLGELDLTTNVAHLIRRAHTRAEHLFVEVMQTPELTPRQTALLVSSYQHPGATIAEVADDIDLDRNTAAEMTARLVKRGLLRRERSETDGRAWSIFVTPDAEAILRQVLPRNAELMERLLEPLPPEYRPLFIKSLRLIVGVEAPDAEGPESVEREDPGGAAGAEARLDRGGEE